jgi:CRP-like cAMP-binding protein
MFQNDELLPLQPSRLARAKGRLVVDSEFAKTFEALSSPFMPGSDRALCRQGEAPARIFLILRGESTPTVGEYAIHGLRVGPGSLIGLSAFFAAKPYAVTIKASEGAVICAMNSEEFVKLIDRKPNLYLKTMQILAAETDALFQTMATAVV